MKPYALLFLFGLFSIVLNAQQAIDTAYYKSELARLADGINRRNTIEELIISYEKLVEKALREGYPTMALLGTLGIAKSHDFNGDAEKAKHIADSVRQVASTLKLKDVHAKALYEMSVFSWKMGHLYAAISELGKAENIYLEIEDKTGLQDIYRALGTIHYDLDDFKKSEEYDLKAMDLALTIGDKSLYFSNYFNYAYNLAEEGKYQEASLIFDEILEGLTELDEDKALALFNFIYGARLEFGPSKPTDLNEIHKNLAYVEKNKGKLPQRNDLAYLYYNLAKYYLMIKKPQKALGYIEKQIPLLKLQGKYQTKPLLQKSKYYELMGIKDSALMFYKIYEEKNIAAIRNKEQNKIQALNLLYEREKKDNEIAAKDLKIQLLAEQSEKQRLYLLFVFGTFFVLVLGALALYLKHRNRLLQKARMAALQGAKAKSLFLDTITHELRTPLSTILGSAYLLEGEKNMESSNGLVKTIRFASEYLNKLIENTILLKTLEVPQPAEKGGKTLIERFNFRELVAGMRGTIVHSKNNNRLEIQIDKNIPKYLIGPELDLNRILVNLLSNSDKFTQNGLIKIIVQKSVTTLEDHIALTFTVSDNGSGIRDDEKEKVFDAFYSGKEHRSDRYTGMGLGLNLVKALLQKHGAEPKLESRLGIGTSISFTMEFGVPKEQDVQIPSPISKDEKAKQSILLVEDNEVNQDMIKRIIEGLGYYCDVADNGKIAVKKYKALPYSLVLMDMMMPVMDGFEATLLIKEFDPKAIIVGLTAVSKEKYNDIFKELNLAAVISKPADASTLRSVLEQQLHAKRETTSASS